LVAANVFQIGNTQPDERSKEFWQSIKLIESLFTIAWVLNMWAHLFFVMRYWIVTQKIKQIFNFKVDPYFTCKVRALTVSLLVFSAAATISFQYYQFYPNSIN
jgi:hypothetical protein